MPYCDFHDLSSSVRVSAMFQKHDSTVFINFMIRRHASSCGAMLVAVTTSLRGIRSDIDVPPETLTLLVVRDSVCTDVLRPSDMQTLDAELLHRMKA